MFNYFSVNCKNELALVDFLVNYYQKVVTANILNSLYYYEDECYEAVTHERYMQEIEENPDEYEEDFIESVKNDEVITLSAIDAAPYLPTIILGEEDVTEKVMNLIKDIPLAYLCVGGVVKRLPEYKGIANDSGMEWGDYIEDNMLYGKFGNFVTEQVENIFG
jgi:hypothetical protein